MPIICTLLQGMECSFMEKLDFTKNILQKYGIPFDITRKGDILNNSEVKVKDIFSDDKRTDNHSDIFPFGERKDNEGFNGLA